MSFPNASFRAALTAPVHAKVFAPITDAVLDSDPIPSRLLIESKWPCHKLMHFKSEPARWAARPPRRFVRRFRRSSLLDQFGELQLHKRQNIERNMLIEHFQKLIIGERRTSAPLKLLPWSGVSPPHMRLARRRLGNGRLSRLARRLHCFAVPWRLMAPASRSTPRRARVSAIFT